MNASNNIAQATDLLVSISERDVEGVYLSRIITSVVAICKRRMVHTRVVPALGAVLSTLVATVLSEIRFAPPCETLGGSANGSSISLRIIKIRPYLGCIASMLREEIEGMKQVTQLVGEERAVTYPWSVNRRLEPSVRGFSVPLALPFLSELPGLRGRPMPTHTFWTTRTIVS
jgi:hypothetical protein